MSTTTELSTILLAAAAPLQALDREPFFLAVLEELDGEVVGPGSLSRAVRTAQRSILRTRPPIVAGDGRTGRTKYNWLRRAR